MVGVMVGCMAVGFIGVKVSQPSGHVFNANGHYLNCIDILSTLIFIYGE